MVGNKWINLVKLRNFSGIICGIKVKKTSQKTDKNMVNSLLNKNAMGVSKVVHPEKAA